MPDHDPDLPDEGDDIDAADPAETGPPTWPVTYAHAEAAIVAAEGNH